MRVLLRDREHRAVVLHHVERVAPDALERREVAVFVEDGREFLHPSRERRLACEAPLRGRDPLVAPLCERGLDALGWHVAEELVRELAVRLREQRLRPRGQTMEPLRPAAASRLARRGGRRHQSVGLQGGYVLPRAGDAHAEHLGELFGGCFAATAQRVEHGALRLRDGRRNVDRHGVHVVMSDGREAASGCRRTRASGSPRRPPRGRRARVHCVPRRLPASADASLRGRASR